MDKQKLSCGDTPEARRAFINNNESSIYEGINEDGEKIMVELQKGVGMNVSTVRKSKPNWYEVQEFDNLGFCISLSYESIKLKKWG